MYESSCMITTKTKKNIFWQKTMLILAFEANSVVSLNCTFFGFWIRIVHYYTYSAKIVGMDGRTRKFCAKKSFLQEEPQGQGVHLKNPIFLRPFRFGRSKSTFAIVFWQISNFLESPGAHKKGHSIFGDTIDRSKNGISRVLNNAFDTIT